MVLLNKVSFSDVDFISGFWADRLELNSNKTIFAVEDRFEETGRFEAFKFNWTEGSDIPKPHFFWDSDVAKWMQSAAYILQKKDSEELTERVEELIDDIERNQDENGYFNIYHTVVEPELRFKNRDHHELYCLGHFIEAAIAYYNATGKDRFLNIIDKYIDYVIKVFCVEKTSEFYTPGHEEIELALYKMYNLKKDSKYLKLANYFLDNRHLDTLPENYWCVDKYFQSHLPVKEQTTAEGHSVRACYLYSGMADYARYNNDDEMLNTCKILFDDIVRGKMYITGGVGSTHFGESFTVPYDLPNDTAYAETCASIALAYFANRMKDIDLDSKYADVVEREIYNGAISGVSLDGKKFFYTNPLEINLLDRNRKIAVKNSDPHLPITQRVEVFGCSCCPPNITRFVASVGSSAFSYSSDSIYIHQYFSCSANILNGEVTVESGFPNDGKVTVNVAGLNGKKLYVRIPGWCDNFVSDKIYSTFKGYAVFDISDDICNFEFDFNMKPQFYVANPHVAADGRKVALTYGPIVYCIERVDNDVELSDIQVDINSVPIKSFSELFNAQIFTFKGTVKNTSSFSELYLPADKVEYKETDVKFIPYYGFANREESDMRVWVNY